MPPRRGYTPLKGSERPRPQEHQFLGPVDANEMIGVTLVIRPKPDSPPLRDLVHWQATPPGKRRFLLPDEYADTYGAAQDDFDAVVAFAAAQGMTVPESHAGRRTVGLN